MGFDGFGGELGRVDLAHFLFRDASLYLMWKWEGNVAAGFGLGIREAAINTVGVDGGELGSFFSDQLDLHVNDRDGLIAIVGHDKKDWQEAMLGEVNGEDLRLVCIVIRIGGDRNLFVAMQIVGGIVERRLRGRLDETLPGDESYGKAECEESDDNSAPAQAQ